MATLPAIDPSTDIKPLIAWVKAFAPTTKNPTPGAPNEVYERLTELAMWLGEVGDFMEIEPRVTSLKAAVGEHNKDVKDRCDRRRAEPVPCTGSATSKCAECPKRRGLYLTVRTQA